MKDDNQKILTVSIAAYNVEKYLDKTLNSLYDPRFLDDIEVLIIDDGSKDNTKHIAQKYAAASPCSIRYIGKENGGHGSTINVGIRLAKGKYFRVIDGDDWVDTDSFAAYVERLKSADADMILTPMVISRNGKEEIKDHVMGMNVGEIYTWDDDISIQLVTLHTMTLRTELLKANDVTITEKCFYVDIEYDIWGIYLSQTISYFGMPTYVYRMGNANQSISMGSRIKNVDMQEKVSYRLAELCEKFFNSGNLPDKMKQLLFERVSVSIYWTIRTYLMLPDGKESRSRIIAFEYKVQNLSSSLFQMLESKRLFKVLRKSHYKSIPVLRKIYRLPIISG